MRAGTEVSAPSIRWRRKALLAAAVAKRGPVLAQGTLGFGAAALLGDCRAHGNQRQDQDRHHDEGGAEPPA